MANSLEARSPFLDHKMLEFTATIPTRFKIGLFNKKIILIKALKNVLPRNILKKKKQGFSIPMSKWMREELSNYTEDILTSNDCKSRKIFNQNYIKNLLYEHKNKIKDNGYRMWTLLCLELWFKEFIDNDER